MAMQLPPSPGATPPPKPNERRGMDNRLSWMTTNSNNKGDRSKSDDSIPQDDERTKTSNAGVLS